jgi:NodT family efflux transporter outer membrane factor (OMF) lipoprotein
VRRSLLIVLATLGALSCASLEVETPGPLDLELRSDWQALPATADPSAAAGAHETQADWWRDFDAPALEALVDDVLARNLDLVAAGARLDAALASARAAGAALLPQASVGLDASRRKQVFVGLPIPGAEGRPLANTSTSIGAALNVSWEADLWGRLRGVRADARLQAAAAEADFEAFRLSLAGQAAKAWFSAVEALGQVELAEAVVESRGASTAQIRRRYLRGLRPALDLRLARSEQAAAEAALVARRRVLDATSRQLRLLAADYPSSGSVDVHLPPLPPPIPAGVPAEIVTRRPDLAALELRVAASGYRLEAAKAALLPGLRLTGSTGRLGQEIDDLLDSDLSVWSLAAGILQPLFQGGRLRAGVDVARAELEGLAASYAQTVLTALREVEQSLVADELLALQYEAFATAREEAKAASLLAGERYRSGLSDYLTVLEADRRLAEANSRLLELERQRLENRVDLYLALGGGWSASPALDPARAAGAALSGDLP